MSENKTIRVSGDCICDHNVYKGNRSTAVSPEARGVRVRESCGGALLLKELIAKATTDLPGWKTEFGHSPDFKTLPDDYHAFCLWEPQVANPREKDSKKQFEVWRAAEPPLGYGQRSEKPTLKACGKGCCESVGDRKDPLSKAPDIVVIDDAGLGFRNAEAKDQWPFAPQSEESQDPRYVVLKVTGSVGEGKLWANLVARNKRNLVLIVSADQLRCDQVRISRGLSWEATAEDLMTEINGNPALQPLLQARHLIVTFRSDGALWMDNDKEGHRPSLLVFDSAMAEGEWSESQGKGATFGFMCCFVSAVVRQLCCTEGDAAPDFEAALIAGLSASRALRRLGHGRVKIPDPTDPKKEVDNPDPGFPFDGIAGMIRQPTEKLVSAVIPPPPPPEKRGSWMMLDEWQVNARSTKKARPHYEAALAVAVLGPETLERFPVAQFGNYQTVDRKEIESLRTIRHLIVDYVKDKRPRAPLNLGVFGPPGSGKSYIVGQIAKAAKIAKDDVLLFNLSQFKDSAEICGALHRVRDRVLKGVTPLVFWDEFDSGAYKWLQFLLAPMEDGEFQDGQITHPLGNCIFAFAGATASTFAEFGPINPNKLAVDLQAELEMAKKLDPLQDAWKAFVLAKGPDFKSRIVAYLNLLGMNRRQECSEKGGRRKWAEDLTDLCFPIRRALFMRTLFDLNKGEALKLDLNLVKALIEIPEYIGAGRSLQFLCTQLKSAVGQSSGRSSMPSPELLSMHVEPQEFWQLCEQDAWFVPKAAKLASLLHEAYRLRIKNRASTLEFVGEFRHG